VLNFDFFKCLAITDFFAINIIKASFQEKALPLMLPRQGLEEKTLASRYLVYFLLGPYGQRRRETDLNSRSPILADRTNNVK